MVKLKFNRSQEFVWVDIQRQLKERGFIRQIILKARQHGISTLIEAFMFQEISQHPHSYGYVVAHDLDSAIYLFGKTAFFYTNLIPELKHPAQYKTRREIVYEEPIGSHLYVDTSKDANLGRSRDIHYLHASEGPFWDNLDASLVSINQAIKPIPGTGIFHEGTANGMGDPFYDMYWAAKRNETDYSALFIPWFWKETNRMQPPPDFEQTKEEIELRKEFGLDVQQIYWRRWIIANNCQGSVEVFKQEHCATDIEAFQAIGAHAFPVDILSAQHINAPPPIAQGYLQDYKFIPDNSGPLKIWHRPNEDYEYDEFTLGVDVAGGDPSGNNSVVSVYSRGLKKQAAEWCGKVPPEQLGVVAAQMGRYYSSGMGHFPALLGIESNNHGHTVLATDAVQDYPNVYFREHVDTISHERTKKIGWETNSKTKWEMIDGLAAALRDGSLIINCKEAIEECLMFHRSQIEKLGRTVEENLALAQGNKKRYTDRVIALAIATRMDKALPPFREYRPQSELDGWRKWKEEKEATSIFTTYTDHWMLS